MSERIVVCGSRTWTDRDTIKRVLAEYESPFVIDGAARGADSLANSVAIELGFSTQRFPADWERHGKTAGFIRNQKMLDEGKPTLVIAFWDGESRGTKDTINRAKSMGIKVRIEGERR